MSRVAGALLVALGLAWCVAAAAEEWSRARVTRLPDAAFAVIETAPDGRRVRHLPHHDETGAVDPAHLRAARARVGQVRWLDPASEAMARQHLEAHGRSLPLAPRSGAGFDSRIGAP